MSVTKRPYIIRDRLNPTVKTRLVIAENPSQALRHVARDVYDVEAASAMDAIRLCNRESITVETAGEEPL